ncbi:MAG TPA: PAS domain S-box protein [Rhodocyclaceae bacterium]|nr:PAS domain S-box protein [Rhodocyclaceae bacterium]
MRDAAIPDRLDRATQESTHRPPRRWLPDLRDIKPLALLLLAFVVAAHFPLVYRDISGHFPLFSPASGLALAALMIYGLQLWPAVLLAAALTAWLAGVSPNPALAVGIGNCAQTLLAAWLLQRGHYDKWHNPTLTHYVALVGVATAATGVAASCGSLALFFDGISTWSRIPIVWRTWWLSETMGALLLTPLLLAWHNRLRSHRLHRLHAILYMLIFIGTHAMLFVDLLPNTHSNQTRAFVVFPLMIWTAIRFGVVGTSTALLGSFLMALASLTLHRDNGLSDSALIEFWMFYSALSVTVMILNIGARERRGTYASLQESRRRLVESEANYRSLADSSSVMIWVSNTDKRSVWFNRGWLEFTGHHLDHEISRGWATSVHPDDLKPCSDTYSAAFEARHAFSMEYRLRHHSGEYRWVLDHGAPRFDASGEFLGFTGSCWDVTERHVADAALAERERTLRTIYDASGAAIFLVDAAGRIVHANQRMTEMFAWPLEALIGLDYVDLIAPEEREIGRHRMMQLLSSETGCVNLERSYWRRDGTQFWGQLSGRRLQDDSGKVLGLVGIITDITERHEAEYQQHLAARVFDASSEGITITDARWRIISVNRAFTEITGYTADEVRGHSPIRLAADRHAPDFFESMLTQIKQSGRWEGEVWSRHRDGHIHPTWLSIAAVVNAHGAVENHIGIFTDISERKSAEARIQHLAHYDYLTELPNRSLLFERMQQTLASAQRYHRRFAVLFIDLDHFKPVNDEHGHDTGDALLREIAHRLRTQVRASDTVARHGGDEFIILTPEMHEETEVEALGAKLLNIVAAPYAINGLTLNVTLSIGIAIYPHDGEDTDTLLHNADAAMYRAKMNGRNGLQFHQPRM